MTIRIRFNMTWTYKRDHFAGAWHQDEDFERRVFEELHRPFAWAYKSDMVTQIVSTSGQTTVMKITWDVNLDGVAGAWHQPEDHAALAQRVLIEWMPNYGVSLEVETLRHADFSEALDHGQMLAHANEIGMKLTSDDYPTFIPETHPSWPEANEVFLQDTHWFWCAPEQSDPAKSCGPAAGPKPERIFTPWDPDYRAQRLAKMMAEYPVAS